MDTGALFYKADLHIHSYGKDSGSYDVIDVLNTPQAIVDTALQAGIQVISITDHNEIQNCCNAIDYAQNKKILVVPGIEISTTQGHLLTYFETPHDLQTFYHKLTFNDDKSICFQGIAECLNKANENRGIGILAHITLESGFEKTIGKFNPQMEQIFRCKNLVGLEITNKEDVDLYTDNDPNADHKNMLKIWREALDNKLYHDFAKVMSSDSHELSKLGKNAVGNNRLTRIKMFDLTFRSLRMAFLSSESRIRLEDIIPEQRPIIKHLHIEGALLDGVDCDLSPNLTCIIGSRGTGKSTLLESIRATTGNPSQSKLCDCEVWPQSVTITYQDETNQQLVLQREKNGRVENKTDIVNGVTRIPIESYGQGDTAGTIQHCDENPQVLIDFLDSFISINPLQQQDQADIDALRNNQSEMRKLRINLVALPEVKKALENEQKKMKLLEQSKAADLVKYHNALIREREFRKNLIEELKQLIQTYSNVLGDNTIFENVAQMDDAEIIVGKDYFQNVKQIVNEIAQVVSQKSDELKRVLSEKVIELKKQLNSWQQKESEIQSKIEIKKQELTQQGIPFDLGKINQIAKDIVEYNKKIKKLQDDQKTLTELSKTRQSLIDNRLRNKAEIYKYHILFSDKINKNLRNSIDDFFVTIKYKQYMYSSEFEDTLKLLMGWRTSQVPKATIIAKSINVYDFVNAIKQKNYATLRNIQNQGSQLLSEEEIQRMILILNENNQYEDLECLSFNDLPEISVTKTITNDNGEKQTISRKIAQLSLGQQQSVLLSILLLSDTDKPLLIDQPEDNLDSEFIFKTIVSNLRKIKEHRQVIIVTHNPNIAVLGDAELILPLKSTNNHSMIMEQGSIDNEQTVKLCCQILEGGDAAFKHRQHIYGY